MRVAHDAKVEMEVAHHVQSQEQQATAKEDRVSPVRFAGRAPQRQRYIKDDSHSEQRYGRRIALR